MPPWLMNLLQQFGRDIVTGAPEAAKGLKKEIDAARDPYLDKRKYWLSRGGEAQRDADDHRFFDTMSVEQKVALATLQASGTWVPYESVKPKDRRPWTGALSAAILPPRAGGLGDRPLL